MVAVLGRPDQMVAHFLLVPLFCGVLSTVGLERERNIRKGRKTKYILVILEVKVYIANTCTHVPGEQHCINHDVLAS